MLPLNLRYFVGLLLVAGCASPGPLGNLMSRNNQKESLGDVLAQRSRTPPPNTAQQHNTWTAEPTGVVQTAGVGAARGEDPRIADSLQAASRAWQSGNMMAARSAYEQVTKIQPDHVYAHSQLAIMADNEGRFADAERHYRVVLRKQPNNPDVLSNIGWSYLLQNRFDESEHALREALQITPRHQKATFNLGWLYGLKGDYDGARTLFLTAGSEAQAQRALAELFPQGAPAASRNGPEWANNNPLQNQNQVHELPPPANGNPGVRSDNLLGNRSPDPRSDDASNMNDATRKLYEAMQKERGKQEELNQQRGRRFVQQGQQNPPQGQAAKSQFDPSNRVAPTEYVPPGNPRTVQVDPRQINDMFRRIESQADLSQTQANQPQRLVNDGYDRNSQFSMPNSGTPNDPRNSPAPQLRPNTDALNGAQANSMSSQWPSQPGGFGSPAVPPNGVSHAGGAANTSPQQGDIPTVYNMSQWQPVDNAIHTQQNWGQPNHAGNGINGIPGGPLQNSNAHPGMSRPQSSAIQQAQVTAAQLGLNMGPGAMFPMSSGGEAVSGTANYRPGTAAPQAPVRGGNSLPQSPVNNNHIEFGPINSGAPQGPVIRPTGGIQGADQASTPSNVIHADGRRGVVSSEVTNSGYEVQAGMPPQRPTAGQPPAWGQSPLSNAVIPAPVVPSAQSRTYGGVMNGQPQITPGPANQQARPANSQSATALPNWQQIPGR